jgi:hypothetical protein
MLAVERAILAMELTELRNDGRPCCADVARGAHMPTEKPPIPGNLEAQRDMSWTALKRTPIRGELSAQRGAVWEAPKKHPRKAALAAWEQSDPPVQPN